MSFQSFHDDSNNTQPQPEGVIAPSAPRTSSSSSVSSPPVSHSSPTCRVLLRTLTGQLMPVVFPSFANVTVLQLKQKVEEIYAIPVSFQRTVYAGREMVDSDLLTSYNVENESVIHLVLRQNQPQAQQSESGEGVPAEAEGVGAGGAAGGPGMIAIPIGAANLGPVADVNLLRTLQLSKTVKLFSLIDVVFVIIWSIAFWPLILAVGFCMAGYIGATQFRPALVSLYAVYIVLSIGLRAWLIVYSDSLAYSILVGIGLLIEIYIFTLVVKFVKLIYRFTPEERDAARRLANPRFMFQQ